MPFHAAVWEEKEVKSDFEVSEPVHLIIFVTTRILWYTLDMRTSVRFGAVLYFRARIIQTA